MPYVEGGRSDCQLSKITIALSLRLRAIELALGWQSDLSPSTQGMIFILFTISVNNQTSLTRKIGGSCSRVFTVEVIYHRTPCIIMVANRNLAFPRQNLKATSHSTIFDIPMRPLREDQKHRRRFTRWRRPATPVMVIIPLNFARCTLPTHRNR